MSKVAQAVIALLAVGGAFAIAFVLSSSDPKTESAAPALVAMHTTAVLPIPTPKAIVLVAAPKPKPKKKTVTPVSPVIVSTPVTPVVTATPWSGGGGGSEPSGGGGGGSGGGHSGGGSGTDYPVPSSHKSDGGSVDTSVHVG